MFLNYDVWDANPPSPRIRFRTKYLSSLHQKNKGKGRVGHDKVHQDDPYVVVCIGGCFSFLRDSLIQGGACSCLGVSSLSSLTPSLFLCCYCCCFLLSINRTGTVPSSAPPQLSLPSGP
ncbi:uncharacterized protein LAJ45_02474 [Morchella importuna]|uniref:uncharacterized protein n=1 Tax=Morchella importuna TaxID=1174673 RepID=UPI001E8E3C52|nr:uncharacterized protein LAJ45_02474 [Morchella importuna]KAH8153661.1 hypothetical protein LAJ45_02474 [Morchella importuna]